MKVRQQARNRSHHQFKAYARFASDIRRKLKRGGILTADGVRIRQWVVTYGPAGNVKTFARIDGRHFHTGSRHAQP